MTGDDVIRELRRLSHARFDKQKELMKEYDAQVHYPSCKAVRDSCPHESKGYWERNGIGWSWQECKFCGTRLQEAATDEVGGRLCNDY